MMRMVVLNAALALVAHTSALLQLLTPWDPHQLQARQDAAFLKLLFTKVVLLTKALK